MTAAMGAGTTLAPVRERMLNDARIEADRVVAQARTRAAAIIDQSRREAADAVALAAAAGREQAAPAVAAERARGRERARSVVLGSRREAYDELRRQVLAAVAGLRDEPGYGRLAGRLARMAARAAGPGATTTTAPDGGIVARSRDVVVDCSLSRLAALAVEALGDRVRALWTP